MAKNVNIKVVCLTNEQKKDELHFDYYNHDGNIVGTVAVDEQGRLGWSIWNNEYEDIVLDTVSAIFGFNFRIENNLNYVNDGKEAVPMRFQRALEFIDNKGLIVNYTQNIYFARTFLNGTGKRR